MTRKEMTQIFSAMLLAWPNAEMFKGGVEKLGPTIELWTACLPDVDFWMAQQAVIKLCRECKFPPSIVEFREKAEQVKSEVKAGIEMSWNVLWMDMELGNTPEAACARFPQDSMTYRAIQAIGGPSRLIVTEEHTFADGRKETVKRYNYGDFAAAYERLIRQTNALSSQHKALAPGMKQIGAKT